MVETVSKKPVWTAKLKAYEQPDAKRALWQLANTLIPYALLFAAMVITVQRGLSYWLTLLLAVPAALLLVRIFIFFHDCTHGSFFAQRWANILVGYITGILTFTPYDEWKHSHGVHHSSVSNLDKRGVGDVWTATVAEYEAMPPLKRLGYRLYRNPLVMFGLGPAFIFLLANRLPARGASAAAKRSVHLTNLALLGILLLAHFTIGLRTYVLVQLPIILLAALLGVWLFYVQHQFEGVYWARSGEWDSIRAALEGSSYYKLPKLLQWFSGNIGLHHIHHLRPRIPNYNLQRCYDEVPEVQQVKPLTLRASLKSLTLNIYDEARRELISFRDMDRRRAAASSG